MPADHDTDAIRGVISAYSDDRGGTRTGRMAEPGRKETVGFRQIGHWYRHLKPGAEVAFQ